MDELSFGGITVKYDEWGDDIHMRDLANYLGIMWIRISRLPEEVQPLMIDVFNNVCGECGVQIEKEEKK